MTARAALIRSTFLAPLLAEKTEEETLQSAVGPIPRGTLTEIAGPVSAGRTSLLYSLLANASAGQEFCALLDADDAFDPEMAAESGVKLSQVLWVRCGGNVEHALKAADMLAQAGGFGLVAIDLGETAAKTVNRIPLAAWFRLRHAVKNYNRPLHATESGLDGIDWKAWLGSATPRDPDELRYRRWRWFWDYGNGTLTDLYSHWVDTIHWLMNDDQPLTAQATGSNTHFKEWECPDTLTASYKYQGYVSTYDSTLVQSYEDGGMIFRGDKATLKLDRSGYQLYTEADVKAQATVRPTPARTAKADGDGTLAHMRNFLDCVRTRRQPNSDVTTAVTSAAAAHLGNLAYKTGETVHAGRKPSAWQPLWNERNLDDFIVDTKTCWSAENGVITGRHNGLKYNDFLRTRRHYDDFELKLEFRLKNGEGNTGIQFRSEPVPDSHEVSGYQADIGQQYWGGLYDESRRKKVLAAAPASALAALDKSGWNRYVVRAEGNFISLYLNGIRTVHYVETEPGLLRRGFIALQVHSGPPIQVEFRGVLIREL